MYSTRVKTMPISRSIEPTNFVENFKKACGKSPKRGVVSLVRAVQENAYPPGSNERPGSLGSAFVYVTANLGMRLGYTTVHGNPGIHLEQSQSPEGAAVRLARQKLGL